MTCSPPTAAAPTGMWSPFLLRFTTVAAVASSGYFPIGGPDNKYLAVLNHNALVV